MAAGDVMEDASGNVILNSSGNVLLDDGSGNSCCCGSACACESGGGFYAATKTFTLTGASVPTGSCVWNGAGHVNFSVFNPNGTWSLPLTTNSGTACVWTTGSTADGSIVTYDDKCLGTTTLTTYDITVQYNASSDLWGVAFVCGSSGNSFGIVSTATFRPLPCNGSASPANTAAYSFTSGGTTTNIGGTITVSDP